MNIWCLDFETFFSDDYTLKKLTTEEYIRDPRFEALMLAVRDPQGKLFWLGQEQIKPFFDSIDWSQDAILCHHAHFDGLILSHHFGVRPRAWFDTLSMARLVLGNHLSAALASLAHHFGLSDKSVPYDAFKGKRWIEIDDALRQLLGAGACHDVSLTWDIFSKLAQGFPEEEYAVIDATVRMFTEPVLAGDAQALEAVQQEEQNRKYLLLNKLGATEQHLQSADTFVKILENLGVEVEYKEGKNGPIPAIAKTDDFMKSLEAHPDETISTLAAARLEVRSTLDQTRAGRLLGMAQRGYLPVYLSYCGAHTTRWSGGDRVNLQNLPRGGAIRKAISAPEGCLLAVVDASQIECRILNYVAGQHDVLEAFRQKRDLYCENASRFYGREITKADKLERGLGKTLELGCFAAETLVLTDSGPKAITDVLLSDKLWDGVEWVTHEGVLDQGVKDVITLANIRVTPDHLFLCGSSWLPASTLRAEKTMLRRALATSTGALQSRATWWGAVAALYQWSFSVRAALLSTPSIHTICEAGRLLGVRAALRRWRGIGKRSIQVTRTFARMMPTGKGFSTELLLLSTDAGTPKTLDSATTGAAGLMFMSRGSMTVGCSSRTCYGFLDGTTRVSTSIVRTTIKVTCRIISDLFLGGKTLGTEERSLNCRERTRTYDIAFAGPRNRFAVVSSAGLLIAHNCGYGLGWQRLQAQCHLGAMGSPPVDLTEEEARRGIDVYRNSHSMVTGLWKEAEMVLRVLADKGWMTWRCGMLVKDGRLYGPNGTWLNYTTLEWDAEDRNYRLKTRKGWSKYYGAKLVENVIQYLARIVMSQAMLRIIRNGYRVATTTHDELVVIIPDDGQSEAHLKYLEAELALTPQWMPGIPLAAEGSVSKRYEK